MRVTWTKGKWFQSYKDFEFDYSNTGGALIAGDMGSGKSTLMDCPCWCLFGKTSKDGAADDVRSWYAGDENTEAVTRVETGTENLIVTRIRAKRSANNDFYFQVEGSEEKVRGAKADDTQKLLNERLGVDPDLYIAASYMHQFSDSDQFFISKPKDRREIMEKIADQSFAIMLAEKMSEARKAVKKDLEKGATELARLQGRVEPQKKAITNCEGNIDQWYEQYDRQTVELQERSDNYQTIKGEKLLGVANKIAELNKIIKPAKGFETKVKTIRFSLSELDVRESDHRELQKQLSGAEATLTSKRNELTRFSKPGQATCPTCLGPSENDHKAAHIEEVKADIDALEAVIITMKEDVDAAGTYVEERKTLNEELRTIQRQQTENNNYITRRTEYERESEALKAEENPYGEQIQDHKENNTNPHEAALVKAQEELSRTEESIDSRSVENQSLEKKIAGLTWLYDKSFELRGKLLEGSVKKINTEMNSVLEKYFDAELRIKMTLPDSDKLEVSVTKNGYPAPYKQLSGGERCLVKLAFKRAYMKAAANAAGVQFDSLMLDEALNGLDPAMKVKSFGLIQALTEEYDTVLLIDHHEELKQMFDRQFLVTVNAGMSHVEEVIRD